MYSRAACGVGHDRGETRNIVAEARAEAPRLDITLHVNDDQRGRSQVEREGVVR
jgi:hypothetical protein